MPTPETIVAITELASRQHGVVTWQQLLECGLSVPAIRRLCVAGWLERRNRTVYRLRGTAETWRQRVMIACLSTGGLASHRTAAALHGLDGFRPGIVELLAPRWERRPRRDHRQHESKDLVIGDASTVDSIPCTSLVRTLVDLGAVCSAEHVGQALDHACRDDRDILLAVRQRFVEVARRGRPGTQKMRLLLAERTGEHLPPGSAFEAMTLRLIRVAGLDEPERQHEVRFDDGSRAFLDLAWPRHMVCVECDSLAYHFGKKAHQRDRTRRRRLVLAGWTPLEFTYEDVRDRPEAVIIDIGDALAAAGRRRQLA